MEDFADWHYMIEVQINGSFYAANAAAKLMLSQRAGVIVNILDLSIWQPWHGFTAHSVGKAGLLAMTRQLALELAPHVRVNAVAPGYVLPPDYLPEERIAQMASGTLLGRWGKPEDVAQAVQFLVEADYITGEVIRVDGGESIAKAKQ
jgi:3-oxoacyl-[acyl-carrier protein] reductase/pteridine reductase